MKAIKLMANYECHPLWHASNDQFGDIAPEDLPLSEGLKSRLHEWARLYDETQDKDSPLNSGFKSEELEAEFKAKGHRLATQLQNELGSDFVVITQI